MGRELALEQRSDGWFSQRRKAVVTGSRFADVVGRGMGTPWDFFTFYYLEENGRRGPTTREQQHGIDFEPIINEAYQFLTGSVTQAAGLYVPDEHHPLHGYVAASPDGKVLAADGSIAGLVEFKAPFHTMYSNRHNKTMHGIPLAYLCQIQGHMLVSGVTTWCDFLAMCKKTRQICLKRVFYCPEYCNMLQQHLLRFSQCVSRGEIPEYLKSCPRPDLCEDRVRVEERLVVCSEQCWQYLSRDTIRFTWPMLVGEALENTAQSDHSEN
eukprot:m.97798 g.97798  ORF g.97798 m.97798 type:complete len:268 (-) comp18543_c0_seq14:331-1134(-)